MQIEESVTSLVSELEHQAENAEVAQAVVSDVIEQAAERIEDAEKVASDMARAAMETHLGREIETLKNEATEWHREKENLAFQMETLKTEMSEMKAMLAATATLSMTQSQTPVLSSSIPDQSEVAEAISEIQEIIPEPLQNVADESPVQPPPRKARRWI